MVDGGGLTKPHKTTKAKRREKGKGRWRRLTDGDSCDIRPRRLLLRLSSSYIHNGTGWIVSKFSMCMTSQVA